MTISRKLVLAALVPVAMALVAVGGVLLSYTSASRLQSQQAAVIQVRTDLIQLNEFARSYLLHFDDRSRRQFLATSDATRRDLSALSPDDPRYGPRATIIGDDVRDMRTLFDGIVSNHSRASASSQAQELLSTQLFIRSTDANTTAASLVRTISADIVARERLVSLAVSAITILAAAVLAVLLLALRAGIIRSLRELKAGTERLAAGDLDYRIGLPSDDELGALAASFDGMTGSLKSATVSKSELEREVEERGRAEERATFELETTQALLEAADALSHWTDLDGVLAGLTGTLLKTCGHSRVSVAVWDEATSSLTRRASAGEDALPLGVLIPFDTLGPAVRTALEDRRFGLIDFDAHPSERTKGMRDRPTAHLALVVPLTHGDSLIGAFVLDDPGTRRDFTEREIRLAEGIASQAAVAIENARLHERTEQQLSRTTLLQHVALAASTGPDLLTVAQGVLLALREDLGLKGGDVSVLSDGRLKLVESFNYAEESAQLIRDVDVATSELMGPRAVRAGRTLSHEDEQLTPERLRLLETQGILDDRYAYVPLRYREDVVGVLGLTFPERRAFTERELSLFASVAQVVGQAVNSARLFDAERAELARTTVLKEVASAAATLDLSQLGRRVLDALRRLLGVKSAALYLLDEETRVLNAQAVVGYREDIAPIFDEVPLDDRSVSGLAVLRDEVLRFDFDDLPELTRQRAEAAGETEVRWLVVPVRLHGKAVGNFTITFAPDRAIDESNASLLLSVGDQIGVAIENARLFEAQREAARYSEALNDIDAAISSTLDVERIMQDVLERSASTVSADAATIWLPSDGHWEARFTWQQPEWMRGTRVLEQDTPFSFQAARRRQVMLFRDPSAHEGWEGSVGQRLGAREVLDAPLLLRGEDAGEMALYKLQGRHFTEADLDFLRKASASVSLALQNAQRYGQEHEVAEALQEGLLALPEEIAGIQFAHAYHSAAEAARVGGDFYDVFAIGRDLVGVTIGDVAGKGLVASKLTSVARNTIRAHASEKGAAPGRILELTNDVVFASSPPDSFVTIFFGVLDRRDGRFVYASAGHTTGGLTDAGGTTTRLPATGTILGAFEGVPFGEVERSVGPRQTLFLYTDGLTEARRGDELFGEERVFDLLSRLGGRDPAEVVRAVVEKVLDYAGGRLNDDLALLALKRVEGTPRPQRVEV